MLTDRHHMTAGFSRSIFMQDGNGALVPKLSQRPDGMIAFFKLASPAIGNRNKRLDPIALELGHGPMRTTLHSQSDHQFANGEEKDQQAGPNPNGPGGNLHCDRENSHTRSPIMQIIQLGSLAGLFFRVLNFVSRLVMLLARTYEERERDECSLV
jgi:hypothetical protein